MFLSQLLEMAIDFTSGNYGTYAEVMDRFLKEAQTLNFGNLKKGVIGMMAHSSYFLCVQ